MKCKHKVLETRCKRPPVESLSEDERKRLIELGYILEVGDKEDV